MIRVFIFPNKISNLEKYLGAKNNSESFLVQIQKLIHFKFRLWTQKNNLTWNFEKLLGPILGLRKFTGFDLELEKLSGFQPGTRNMFCFPTQKLEQFPDFDPELGTISRFRPGTRKNFPIPTGTGKNFQIPSRNSGEHYTWHISPDYCVLHTLPRSWLYQPGLDPQSCCGPRDQTQSLPATRMVKKWLKHRQP